MLDSSQEGGIADVGPVFAEVEVGVFAAHVRHGCRRRLWAADRQAVLLPLQPSASRHDEEEHDEDRNAEDEQADVQGDPSEEDRGKGEHPCEKAGQRVIDYPPEPAETDPRRLRPEPVALPKATWNPTATRFRRIGTGRGHGGSLRLG